jgi:2-polyprenyl-6-methoxyphenol hydroxylase-like FAD-dependent oxidoreductase
MLSETAVLVVGAGPSGLMLALELCRHGLTPRLIDGRPGPSPLSRALVVHARTLELLDRHGLAEAFVARGEVVRGGAMRRQGRVVASVPLGRIGGSLSPFPFLLMLSQDQTEGLLREALANYGLAVQWNTTLVDMAQDAAGVTAMLQVASGPPMPARVAYLAGCDGAGSAVRKALGIGFPGGTYEQTFFVADTVTAGLPPDPQAGRQLQISLAPRTFNAFFPMPNGRTRLIGLLPDGVDPATATFADVQPALEATEHIRVQSVSWFSTYRVHHRVADHFWRGRTFLVGDAGHIHSPAGGQGMNTGMGDAVNLGWKLAAALRSATPAEALLATYEAERLPFARQLVATTDRAFTGATRPSAWAGFVRSQLAPRLLPLALRFSFFRRRLFRTISQIAIAYPNSPLSQGHTAAAAGGQRLPWGPGRYHALRAPGWHLLHTGPSPAAMVWAAARGHGAIQVVPVAGEPAGTVYLVRPDGYLGLVTDAFSEAVFSAYAEQWEG